MALESSTIELVQGSSRRQPIYVMAPDDDNVLQVVDIEAATEITFGIFVAAVAEETPLVEKTMSASQIELPNGGSDGLLEVVIPGSDTLSVNPAEDYEWQLKVVLGGDTPLINRAGTLILYPSGAFS